MKMLILSGLPASGKSTYAQAFILSHSPFACRINWDSQRFAIPNYKFSKENEKKIKQESYEQLKAAAQKGLDVIIDNTNLSLGAQGTWILLGTALGYEIEYKNFDTPVEECIRRDALRTGREQVGQAVIDRMALAAGLINWGDQKIVIVDMDGTLADSKHRIRARTIKCPDCKGFQSICGQYPIPVCQKCGGHGTIDSGLGKIDWKYFYQEHLILQDHPKPVIVEWVRELSKDHTIVVVSGRPEDRTGKTSVQWLHNNQVPFNHIFMRHAGDMRDDTIVKQEILDKLPKDQIAFAIDDRNRVIDMWRANGVKAYQVIPRDEGDF